MLYLPFNVYLDSKRVNILIEAVFAFVYGTKEGNIRSSVYKHPFVCVCLIIFLITFTLIF